MKVPLEFVQKVAQETTPRQEATTKARWGRVLDPIPVEQSQEGPTCGFYALSIVMDYWKAKGSTQMSAPARKRDIATQSRDQSEADSPSLRNLGKQIGALDVGTKAKVSTGGVWTAAQLAAVARAVKFANFRVSIETQADPHQFIVAICRGINAGIPPIVAFDIREAEPVSDAAGQRSHWGVVIGYFAHNNAAWFIATHGHGGYHVWQTTKLQESNFALSGTTVNKELEHKVRGSGTGMTGKLEKYNRTQWIQTSTLDAFSAKAAERQIDIKLEKTEEVREAFNAVQDLGHHIVLVEPAT